MHSPISKFITISTITPTITVTSQSRSAHSQSFVGDEGWLWGGSGIATAGQKSRKVDNKLKQFDWDKS